MWWPPYHSWPGFINATIFLLLSASTFYNFLYSLHVGPGYLPLKWKPVNALTGETLHEKIMHNILHFI